MRALRFQNVRMLHIIIQIVVKSSGSLSLDLEQKYTPPLPSLRRLSSSVILNVSKMAPPLAKPTRPTGGSTNLYKIDLSFIYLGPKVSRLYLILALVCAPYSTQICVADATQISNGDRFKLPYCILGKLSCSVF